MKNISPTTERKSLTVDSCQITETIWPVTSFKLFIVHVHGYILVTIGSGFLFWNQNFCLQISTVCYFNKVRYLFGMNNQLTLPRTEKFFTLKLLLHSELKQVMSLFTLGSARAVLVVALVYSFPDVFNVIMALISPYTNQPFIVPIRWTSIVS